MCATAVVFDAEEEAHHTSTTQPSLSPVAGVVRAKP